MTQMKALGLLLFIVLQVVLAQPPYRINCGGSAYTDSSGKQWAADSFVSGGNLR